MTAEQSFPPRYWIFKDTDENHFFQGDRSPEGQKLWIVEPSAGVKAADVVYFWREEDSSYFYGWGVIETDPALLEPDEQNASSAEPRVGVQVRYRPFFSKPVMRGELRDHPTLKQLFALREPRQNIIELSDAQAAALSQLIRDHGFEAPPDPPMEFSRKQEDIEEDQPTDTTLSQLLETYQLSGLSRRILKLAGQFANRRESNRDRVTTSCLLFAGVEVGAELITGPPLENVEKATQFLFEWMHQDEVHSAHYQQALSEFMHPENPERRQGLASLTMRTMKVIRNAASLAAFVRKETEADERGVIHARDLIGGLLITMAADARLGAAHRLAGMDVDLEALRRDFFNNFLNHEKNVADDIERWHQVLIDLKPLPEQDDVKVSHEANSSLPSIDADTPSLKDNLSITAEVNGFANIIAARDVKTPLSIGLFGDWGSGKSTFMEQLQAAVDEIAKSVREKKETEETSFLGNIVQIKFNAWHYAEANLWASLVSHVFENLSFSDAEEKEKAEKRKQLFLGKLVNTLSIQKAAEADVKIKEANFESAKTALDGAQRERNEAQIELREVLTQGVWPLVQEFLGRNPEAQRQLNEARRVLGRAGLSEEELKREIEATQTTVGRIQLQITSIANDPRRALKIAGILLLSVLVPVVLTFAVARLGNGTLERLIASVTPLLTLIGGALTLLRTKRKTVDSMLDTLDTAARQIDQMYARAQAKYDSERERLEKEVSQKQVELDSAKKNVEDAKKERVETINVLREMEPDRVLETFVQERAASEDYRKLLGVVALIRRDFKRLSDMLRQQGNVELRQAVTEILKKDEEQRKAEQAPAAANGGVQATATEGNNGHEATAKEPDKQLVDETLKEYRIDRIVLYIDDLDRCPPKQVVDVLQAIHLLLAFELFVVVVGVDARWIRHALRKRFPEMLSEDWDEDEGPRNGKERPARKATPRDYVEKIFQVPFWLKPMDDDASRELLEGLIPESQLLPAGRTNGTGGMSGQTRDANGQGQQTGDRSDSAEESQPDSDENGAKRASATGAQTPTNRLTKSTGAGSAKSDEPARKPPLVLKPESLLLDKKERDAMIALSRVIGKTPRTLKRFVNVYRIIKAGLNAKQLENFTGAKTADGQYLAVLVLLGVAHGAPDLAPFFFRALKHRHDEMVEKEQTNVGLKTLLTSMATTGPATLDESLLDNWQALIRNLEQFTRGYKEDIPIAVLREWLPVVVRYTFQLGRLSEEVATAQTRELELEG